MKIASMFKDNHMSLLWFLCWWAMCIQSQPTTVDLASSPVSAEYTLQDLPREISSLIQGSLSLEDALALASTSKQLAAQLDLFQFGVNGLQYAHKINDSGALSMFQKWLETSQTTQFLRVFELDYTSLRTMLFIADQRQWVNVIRTRLLHSVVEPRFKDSNRQEAYDAYQTLYDLSRDAIIQPPGYPLLLQSIFEDTGFYDYYSHHIQPQVFLEFANLTMQHANRQACLEALLNVSHFQHEIESGITNPLLLAVDMGNVEMVEFLLKDGRIDPTAGHNQVFYSTLRWSYMKDGKMMAETLLTKDPLHRIMNYLKQDIHWRQRCRTWSPGCEGALGVFTLTFPNVPAALDLSQPEPHDPRFPDLPVLATQTESIPFTRTLRKKLNKQERPVASSTTVTSPTSAVFRLRKTKSMSLQKFWDTYKV